MIMPAAVLSVRVLLGCNVGSPLTWRAGIRRGWKRSIIPRGTIIREFQRVSQHDLRLQPLMNAM